MKQAVIWKCSFGLKTEPSLGLFEAHFAESPTRGMVAVGPIGTAGPGGCVATAAVGAAGSEGVVVAVGSGMGVGGMDSDVWVMLTITVSAT